MGSPFLVGGSVGRAGFTRTGSACLGNSLSGLSSGSGHFRSNIQSPGFASPFLTTFSSISFRPYSNSADLTFNRADALQLTLMYAFTPGHVYISTHPPHLLLTSLLTSLTMLSSIPNKPHQTAVPLDFLVVGGSSAGLAAAYALRRVGHRVLVLEQNADFFDVSPPFPSSALLCVLIFSGSRKAAVADTEYRPTCPRSSTIGG